MADDAAPSSWLEQSRWTDQQEWMDRIRSAVVGLVEVLEVQQDLEWQQTHLALLEDRQLMMADESWNLLLVAVALRLVGAMLLQGLERVGCQQYSV